MLVDYSYLGQGRPVIANYSSQPGVELTYYTSGGSGDAGDQYTGLDRFGRIVDQRWVQSSTDKERVKYGYDRASNRQWRQNTVAGTGQDEYYTYDGLYQVSTLKRGTLTGTPPSGISGTPSWEENWNYDPTGNWRGSSTGYLTKVSGSTTLNQNRTHNVANEITDITESTGTAWPTPTQDAAGNLTVVPRPLSLGNSFDLKWDAWNRLMEVKNTGGSVIATYRYDGASRRVTKDDGTDTRHYYYSDQWQVLEERLNSSSSADRRFVWGLRSVDDLILRDDTSQRLYALSDALGSVTAVVNTSGTVQERYGYDGFGTPRYMDGSFGSRGSSSYAWETLFDGYRYDLESGLYQVRYRFLHPNLGRWPNRDPLQEKGGVNLYGFVRNNPLNLIDSDGRAPMGWPVLPPPGRPPSLPPKPPQKPKNDKCCTEDNPAKDLFKTAGDTLAGEVGGKVGGIVRLILLAGDAKQGCADMKAAGETCLSFARKAASDPGYEFGQYDCEACCHGIMNSFPGLGGISYFQCHAMCAKF